MIHPDSQTLRTLVQERHAQLRSDALRLDEPEPVASSITARRRRRRVHLPAFRIHLRSARRAT